MRLVLLDGIIHRNPLLSLFCCFSSFSLSHFPFLLESFDRHVSHHLHSIHDSGFFLYNDVHNVFHASLNCFPRSTITLYLFSYDRLFQLFHNPLYISLITGSNHFIGRFLLHDLLCKIEFSSNFDPVPFSRTSTTNLRL